MAGTDAGAQFTAQTRLLVIAPHPDDETIATGMLIQRVRAAGGEVDILLLTSGDNNPWPQRVLERRLRIGTAERARWGRRRRLEMLRAMRKLDVAPDHLHALEWPDMGLTGLLLQPGSIAVQTIAALLAQLQPTLLVLPALADRHPDHGAAHVLARLALVAAQAAPEQWAYLVHGVASATTPIEIDGIAVQRTVKQVALAAHASQMALSGGRLRRLAGGAERYLPLAGAGGGASASALPWQPPAWLRPMLRLSVVDARGAASWPWLRAPLRIDGAGVAHLAPVTVDEAGGPRFARLALRMSTPWIFDHWGWCELG